MHGLIRVRQFHLSDGHIVCTPEQVEAEFRGCLELSLYFLKCLGLDKEVTFRFSRWDPDDKEKYIDDPEAWESAESRMKNILDNIGLDYVEAKGEAAFYGPKLDIQICNVYGKEDTLMTVQVDMLLAHNFDMWYVDADGEKKTPYIIHRGAFGCYERVMAILIEKYAGALPLWMNPTQVKVMSLTDRTIDEVKKIKDKLSLRGIRADIDVRSEKIGYKIRDAQMDKTPYMLIVGDKEVENGVVAVRSRLEGDLGTMPLDDFINKVLDEVASQIARD